MGQAEILIAGILVAVAGLAALARLLSIPYPIILVIGGAAIGFVPGIPAVQLDPDVVLVVFLPPLLYYAAFNANFRDLRADQRNITLSSVGLVLATLGVVAVVAHELIPGLSWPAAFALGAIVSPTDPLAAGLVMRQLGVPRRLVSSVDGEGLFNDATALIAYRFAVAAVIGWSVSLAGAGFAFVAGAAEGIAIGFVVGHIAVFIRRRIADIPVNLTVSLLSGYAAFIPANAIGASAVLAVVTTGIVVGGRSPRILPARTRLQTYTVWEMLNFLINAALFVLIGLQLRSVVTSLTGWRPPALAAYALAVGIVVILMRIGWFFSVPYVIRLVDRRASQRARRIGARQRFVLAWSGMRGGVSLAAALALPLTTRTGAPFPDRNLLIFLTFTVIFSTLVLQGLSLPALIRRLGITDEGAEAGEDLHARLVATKAALAQIDALAEQDWTRADTIERMRGAYDYRKRRLTARAGKIEDDGYEDRSLTYQQTVRTVLGAQRTALLRLRDGGEISTDVMNRILRELDLEEARLQI